MVLNDWQRGKLPYFSNPEEVFNLPAPDKPEDELEHADSSKREAAEKRNAIEAKLVLDKPDWKNLKEKLPTTNEDDEQDQDGLVKKMDDSEDDDVIQMDESIKVKDANHFDPENEEDELEKLEKQYNMLKAKSKIMDESRLEIIEKSKKQSIFNAMAESAYGAEKGARKDKRRNIDIKSSLKRAKKMID